MKSREKESLLAEPQEAIINNHKESTQTETEKIAQIPPTEKKWQEKIEEIKTKVDNNPDLWVSSMRQITKNLEERIEDFSKKQNTVLENLVRSEINNEPSIEPNEIRSIFTELEHIRTEIEEILEKLTSLKKENSVQIPFQSMDLLENKLLLYKSSLDNLQENFQKEYERPYKELVKIRNASVEKKELLSIHKEKITSSIDKKLVSIDEQIKKEQGVFKINTLFNKESNKKISELKNIKVLLQKTKDWFSKQSSLLTKNDIDEIKNICDESRSLFGKTSFTENTISELDLVSIGTGNIKSLSSYFELPEDKTILERNERQYIEKSDEFALKTKESLGFLNDSKDEITRTILPILKKTTEFQEKNKKKIELIKEILLPVYKDLGIDDSSQKLALDKWRTESVKLKTENPNQYAFFEKAYERSFDNIRESTKLHLNYYIKEQGVDALPRLIEELKAEINNVRQSFFIEYREDSSDFLNEILPSGEIKTLQGLKNESSENNGGSEKILAKAGAGSGLNDGYHQRRNKTSLSLFGTAENSENVTYALLGNKDEPKPTKTTAPGAHYGGLRLVLDWDKIKTRTLFTERDSMNPEGLTYSLKNKGKESDSTKCQLLPEHSIISKAIYNLDAKRDPEKVFYIKSVAVGDFDSRKVDVGSLHYVEAHILNGFSLEDVKEIWVNLSESNSQEIIEKIKGKYPNIVIHTYN